MLHIGKRYEELNWTSVSSVHGHGGESRALVDQFLFLLSDQLAAPLLGLVQQLLLAVPLPKLVI